MTRMHPISWQDLLNSLNHNFIQDKAQKRLRKTHGLLKARTRQMITNARKAVKVKRRKRVFTAMIQTTLSKYMPIVRLIILLL